MIPLDELGLMIQDCKRRANKLTEFECYFIDAISEKFERGIDFTTDQIKKIDEIWERVT